MPNYYDFLKISPSASASEIQVALDTLYNQSRRLVTNHAPEVVQQANQALLTIEQVSTTLLDPVKRANYDATLNNSIGGVFDPSAQGQPRSDSYAGPGMVPMSPPNVHQPQLGGIPQAVSNGWVCPKCHFVEPVGTKFCKNCGQTLGKECPKCRTLLEPNTQFCRECGVNVREHERALEIQTAEAEAKRIAEQRRLAEIEAVIGPVKRSAETAANMWKIGCVLSLCYGVGGIPFWIISFINAQKALSFSQTYGDTVYRQKASTARIISGIALGLTGAIIVLYAGLFFLQAIGALSQR